MADEQEFYAKLEQLLIAEAHALVSIVNGAHVAAARAGLQRDYAAARAATIKHVLEGPTGG